MKEKIFDIDPEKLKEEFSEEKGNRVITGGTENALDLDVLEEEMRAEVKIDNLDIPLDAQKWLDSLDPSLLKFALEGFVLKQTRPIKVTIEKSIASDGTPQEQLLLIGHKKLGQQESYPLASRSLDSQFKF